MDSETGWLVGDFKLGHSRRLTFLTSFLGSLISNTRQMPAFDFTGFWQSQCRLGHLSLSQLPGQTALRMASFLACLPCVNEAIPQTQDGI